jgi:hypothetical protein
LVVAQMATTKLAEAEARTWRCRKPGVAAETI